ncbi:MAG: prepilin-type N-terminal cleavage/methylation domain-containing protein, partial [Candidatus Saccharimonas sp.]
MSNTFNYHHPSPITQTYHTNKRGFTIVELLIVIVVIAILAAISIVAYNGIQNRAHDTLVQNDIMNAGKQLELYFVDHDAYPTTASELFAILGSVNVTSY